MKECQAEKREAESKGWEQRVNEGVKNKGLMKECQQALYVPSWP